MLSLYLGHVTSYSWKKIIFYLNFVFLSGRTECKKTTKWGMKLNLLFWNSLIVIVKLCLAIFSQFTGEIFTLLCSKNIALFSSNKLQDDINVKCREEQDEFDKLSFFFIMPCNLYKLVNCRPNGSDKQKTSGILVKCFLQKSLWV